MFKKIAAAAVATSLLAAPVAAANPAAALSLSPEVRAGETMTGESDLFGGALGTLASAVIGLLSTYLLYELIDGESESA